MSGLENAIKLHGQPVRVRTGVIHDEDGWQPIQAWTLEDGWTYHQYYEPAPDRQTAEDTAEQLAKLWRETMDRYGIHHSLVSEVWYDFLALVRGLTREQRIVIFWFFVVVVIVMLGGGRR